MVRKERLELSRLATLEPKSSVSTNSTTPASGARNGARTRDNRNHNPGLYQLSYSRHKKSGAPNTIRTYDLRLRRPLLYPAELRSARTCTEVNLKMVGEKDSNLRPLGPKPSALPSCATHRLTLTSFCSKLRRGA